MKISAIQWLLKNDERLIEFLFSHKGSELRTGTVALLREARDLSRDERLLIQVAIDFWNRQGETLLSDLLNIWNNENWYAFIEGIIRLKELDWNHK